MCGWTWAIIGAASMDIGHGDGWAHRPWGSKANRLLPLDLICCQWCSGYDSGVSPSTKNPQMLLCKIFALWHPHLIPSRPQTCLPWLYVSSIPDFNFHRRKSQIFSNHPPSSCCRHHYHHPSGWYMASSLYLLFAALIIVVFLCAIADRAFSTANSACHRVAVELSSAVLQRALGCLFCCCRKNLLACCLGCPGLSAMCPCLNCSAPSPGDLQSLIC